MSAPIVYLTRRDTFAACHRLHNVQLSESENKQIFGKCNNPNGHGHNYVVEVTVRGPVDPRTGMVMNMSDLKVYIEKAIMKQLDHKNIDKDVPYFKYNISTAENIAIYIFDSLKNVLPHPELLYEVKLFETEKNIARYRGDQRHTHGHGHLFRNGVVRPERRLSENIIANMSSDSDS